MRKRLLAAALAAMAVASPAVAQKTVTIVREIDTDRYDPQKSTSPMRHFTRPLVSGSSQRS